MRTRYQFYVLTLPMLGALAVLTGCTGCLPPQEPCDTVAQCDDANACTADACTQRACTHTPVSVDDSNACTADACAPSTGAITHAPVSADDSNACTTDACDPVAGVTHTPVNVDDGVACTADSCAGGQIGHVPVDSRCEVDGFSCTVPTCDPVLGCRETATPAVCGDSVDCTADRCLGAGGTAGTGCAHVPNDFLCPSNQVCTASGCRVASPTDQVGTVIVTELRILGAELIEIRNTTGGPLDVHGFVFENLAGDLAEIRAPSDPTGASGTAVTIPAGGYAYGVPNPASGGTVPANAAFVYGDVGTTFALADMGDVLTLHSAGGATLQDAVDFRNLVTDPNAVQAANSFPAFAGVTTQLDPGSQSATANDSGANWCTTFYPAVGAARVPDTAGAANGSCHVAVINEVLIDASGTDDGKTFVEIAGPGGGSIGGARLDDVEGKGATAGQRNTDGEFEPGETDGEVVLPAGLRIPVDGSLLLADGTVGGATQVPNVSPADLVVFDMDMENGGGDSLQLIAADGTLLDAAGHDLAGAPLDVSTALNGLAMAEGGTALYPPAGVSLARSAGSADTNDNRADVHGDPSPTPGAPNDAVSLSVTSLEPDDGLASIVSSGLTVNGTDFASGASITFGTGPTTLCTVLGPTKMNCSAPANGGVPARVSVTVTNPASVGGTVTVPNAFTYTGVLNETDTAAEADYCTLTSPASFSVTQGQPTPTLFGRLFEAGVTDPAGAPAGVLSEVGFGPAGTDPTAQARWQFFPATFNAQVGTDDEFSASFTAPAVTVSTAFAYAFRFSVDGGLNYTYCDLNGAGSNAGLTFEPGQLGSMTVTP